MRQEISCKSNNDLIKVTIFTDFIVSPHARKQKKKSITLVNLKTIKTDGTAVAFIERYVVEL